MLDLEVSIDLIELLKRNIQFKRIAIQLSLFFFSDVWGFPYKAYENGGGAFLIPYMIVMILIGRPMYFLELVLGQFSSKSSIKIWDVVPAFRGKN